MTRIYQTNKQGWSCRSKQHLEPTCGRCSSRSPAHCWLCPTHRKLTYLLRMQPRKDHSVIKERRDESRKQREDRWKQMDAAKKERERGEMKAGCGKASMQAIRGRIQRAIQDCQYQKKAGGNTVPGSLYNNVNSFVDLTISCKPCRYSILSVITIIIIIIIIIIKIITIIR